MVKMSCINFTCKATRMYARLLLANLKNLNRIRKKHYYGATTLIHSLILITALCMDEFLSGIAYGSGRIRIRFFYAVIINIISTVILGLSLVLGVYIDSLISETFTRVICFCCLLILGFIKLMDYFTKAMIRKHIFSSHEIHFSISELNFILQIYASPASADIDDTKSLSLRESIFFALAMSIDGLVSGIGVAFLKLQIPLTLALSFFLGILLLYAGCLIGSRIQKILRFDLSWVSGVLFLVLALLKILS